MDTRLSSTLSLLGAVVFGAALTACGDELVSDEPVSGGGSGYPSAPGLSCGEIDSCTASCSQGDTRCAASCAEQGSPAARAQYNQVIGCLEQNGCYAVADVEAFYCCAEARCAGSIGACLPGYVPQCGSGSGGGAQPSTGCPRRADIALRSEVVCEPLPPTAVQIARRLTTVWGTQPSRLCRYPGGVQAQSSCGPLTPMNAFYCPLDDLIGYDLYFINQQAQTLRNYAAVLILSHEWGHLNQARVGFAPGRPQILDELNADCQAGVFAAVEGMAGRVDMGDLDAAFRSLVQAGDPATPWINPNGHGTAQQRLEAFEHGLNGGLQLAAPLCGVDPRESLQTTLQICSRY